MRLIRSNALGAASAVLTLAIALAGCAKDIDTQPGPGAFTQALFDPTLPSPVVPTPNDLAKDRTTGLLAVPVADAATNLAQHEFDTYLNTLDGYPTVSSVSACFSAEVKAETLAAGLQVVQLPAAADAVPAVVEGVVVVGDPVQTITCPVLTPMPCNPAGGEMTGCMPGQACIPTGAKSAVCANPGFKVALANPAGWERGRTYAFYLTNAVLDANDKPVGRSSSFELAAGANPLCEWNATENRCVYNYSALLATQVKTAVKLETEGTDMSHAAVEKMIHDAILASATSFEMLRQATDGLLKLGEATGLKRNEIVLTWAFSISSMTEALFDPTAGVIPGPGNDLLMDTTTGKVNIPESPGETPADAALRMGLNTLDGFSTTGTYYTLFSDLLDPASVTVGEDLFVVNALNPTDIPPVKFEWVEGGRAVTMTPLQPLKEGTRYAVVLRSKANAAPTTPEEAVASAGGLADTKGRRVVASSTFALARSSAPLVDADGKSQVSVLSDANAAALEALRAGYAPLFMILDAQGIKRADIPMIWTFKTQSITTAMTQLRALPYGLAAGDSNAPVFEGGMSTLAVNKQAVGGNWPDLLANDGVSAMGKVMVQGFNALDATTGAFKADPTTGVPYKFPAYITYPAFPTCTGAGDNTCVNGRCAMEVDTAGSPTGRQFCVPNTVPVAIFQHGIGTMKETFFSLANSLGKAGYAVIAFDTIFHGDRTTCADATVCLDTGAECVAAASDGMMRCCATGDNTDCGRAYFKPDANGLPTGNGALFLNTDNPFAIRDNIRQHVIDTSALLRALSLGAMSKIALFNLLDTGGAQPVPALPAADAANINLVSQSLGSMMNVIVLATDSTPKRAALAVPGAPIVEIYKRAQRADFVALVDDLLDARGLCTDDGGTKVCPRDSVGALRLFHTLQWIVDPADPANFAQYVKTNSLNDVVASTAAGSDVEVTKKEVLQLVAGADELILTPLQSQLAGWIGNDVTNSTYAGADHNFAKGEPAASPITAAAHEQITNFLDTGNVCTPDLSAGTCN